MASITANLPVLLSDHLKSFPVRPLRLLTIFAVQALWRVLFYGLISGAVLFLAALGLARALAAGGIGVAWWPLAVSFTGFGLVIGMLAGLASAAGSVLRVVEADLRDWLNRILDSDGEQIVPTVQLNQLSSGYDQAIASLCGATLGRIPLPRFIRGRLESKMRHALMDEFLAACQDRGATTVGFAEVRDFLLRKWLPFVTRPAQAQLRLGMLVLFGILGVCIAATFLVAAIAAGANPRLVVVGTCGVAGVAIVAVGLPRASGHASPWRWRLGILILGAGLALWPAMWIELWAYDLGMVWIVVLGVTAWMFQRGVRLAFLEANHLTLRRSWF